MIGEKRKLSSPFFSNQHRRIAAMLQSARACSLVSEISSTSAIQEEAAEQIYEAHL